MNKKNLKQNICTLVVTINICFIIFFIGILYNCIKREQMTVDTYTYISQSEYDKIMGNTYDEITIDGVILMTQDELENIANEWEKEKNK